MAQFIRSNTASNRRRLKREFARNIRGPIAQTITGVYEQKKRIRPNKKNPKGVFEEVEGIAFDTLKPSADKLKKDLRNIINLHSREKNRGVTGVPLLSKREVAALKEIVDQIVDSQWVEGYWKAPQYGVRFGFRDARAAHFQMGSAAAMLTMRGIHDHILKLPEIGFHNTGVSNYFPTSPHGQSLKGFAAAFALMVGLKWRQNLTKFFKSRGTTREGREGRMEFGGGGMD